MCTQELKFFLLEKIEGCSGVLRGWSGVNSGVLRGGFGGPPKVFQRCSGGAPGLIRGCSRAAPGVLGGRSAAAPRVLRSTPELLRGFSVVATGMLRG